MWAKNAIEQLDEWFVPCGPCAICGGKDARHRLWDSILSRAEAGEGLRLLAKDYALPFAAIKAVIQIRPYHHSKEDKQ